MSEHQCERPIRRSMYDGRTFPWECQICGRIWTPGPYGNWEETRGPRPEEMFHEGSGE